MRKTGNRAFAAVVKKDLRLWLLGDVETVRGDTARRIKASVEWLLRAQESTPDDGVSVGFFPCDGPDRWRPSYPETTGYIAQSLLDYSSAYDDSHAAEQALAAMRWEAEVQMENGAVQGGPVCPPDQQRAAVFNTGMVLQGWTAAWRTSGEQLFLQAGRKAADFLVGDMDDSGHFRTHGYFVTGDRIKTYNVLCAWALLRFAEDTGERLYRDAAIRNVEAVLELQTSNGWLPHNCLTEPHQPLTHTIGYALQGILEVGLIIGRRDFVDAVKCASDAVVRRIRSNGFLAGRLDANWKPAARWSCLTGAAQIAIVLYRLSEATGDTDYRGHAGRLVDFLKGLQRTDTGEPGVDGALAGAFPIIGPYMAGGYPNWATKYLLDALMLQERLS